MADQAQHENSVEQNLLCTTQKSSDSVIREWLFIFATEHREDLAPRLPIWLEAFGGMDPQVLTKLFQRAFTRCKFFPKVSEILEPLNNAEKNAAPEAAEIAWERVMDIRRRHWNPDMPAHFQRACAGLSERVRVAARAAGIWRDFTEDEYASGALHTWAKKKFVESFLAWGERDEYFIPDGEIKNLIYGVAEKKALLSAPSEASQLSPEERLRVADELCIAARKVLDQKQQNGETDAQPATVVTRKTAHVAKPLDEQKAEMRRRGWIQ